MIDTGKYMFMQQRRYSMSTSNVTVSSLTLHCCLPTGAFAILSGL